MPDSSLPDLDRALDAVAAAQRQCNGLNPWAMGALALLALPVVGALFAGGEMVEVGLLGLVVIAWIALRERALGVERKKRLDNAKAALRKGLRAGRWAAASGAQTARLRSALGDAWVEFETGPTEPPASLP